MQGLEVWKTKVLDFNSMGLLVSSEGRVKNCEWIDKAITDNGAGYKKVAMHNKDVRKTQNFYIHRLVAELFLETPVDVSLSQVNHIDGNKSNNAANNLEWTSPKGNIKHMHENGLNKKRREHGTTVTAPNSVIANAYLQVKIGALGVRESADKYGLPRTTLSSIMNKRTRRDVTDVIDSYFML